MHGATMRRCALGCFTFQQLCDHARYKQHNILQFFFQDLSFSKVSALSKGEKSEPWTLALDISVWNTLLYQWTNVPASWPHTTGVPFMVSPRKAHVTGHISRRQLSMQSSFSVQRKIKDTSIFRKIQMAAFDFNQIKAETVRSKRKTAFTSTYSFFPINI